MARERVESVQGDSTEGTLIDLVLLTLTERRLVEMLKKRIINVFLALALLTAAVGASTIVADELGQTVTPQAMAMRRQNCRSSRAAAILHARYRLNFQ
jgi:hypothetical protein